LQYIALIKIAKFINERTTERFDYEINHAFFVQMLPKIREGNACVVRIFPLVRRKIFERAATGTLDESDLKSAIITVGHSLQNEHHVLREYSQDAIFRIIFDAAVDYQGLNEAVSKLFESGTPVLDPKQSATHTMVIAACLGEIKVVQSLLSHGVNPKDPSIYFGSALNTAARHGHASIVKLLLDNGVVAQMHGRFGPCVHFSGITIIAAAQAGHENVIRILMEPKFKHPTSGEAYEYALKRLVEGKHIASVFLLLDCGTFDPPGSIHQIILLIASTSGCLPLVKAMVERGTEVNGIVLHDPEKRPIEQAARGGHEDVVSYLLSHGAKQDGGGEPIRDDAITAAAENGHVGTLKILLQHGAYINSSLGLHRTTPFSAAARNNHVDAVRFLLEKGAALKGKRYGGLILFGINALERAIRRGHKEMVRALAEGGVDVNSVAPNCAEKDPPPILLAKMWSHHDIVTLLLELGAKDVDPLKTRWVKDFRKGVYPQSAWACRPRNRCGV
jgi:ankyrin repeat protein